MTVFEMTVDSIFICFGEDIDQNDGIARPYFMSKELMEFMMTLKGTAGGAYISGGQHVEAGQPNYQTI